MYMRAVTVRIVYFGFMALVVLAGATLRQSTVLAAAAAATPAKSRVAAVSLPVTTLPTIHVQTRALKTGVTARPADIAPAVVSEGSARFESSPVAGGGATLPSLRLDMPYYSFGKLLPRVGKE